MGKKENDSLSHEEIRNLLNNVEISPNKTIRREIQFKETKEWRIEYFMMIHDLLINDTSQYRMEIANLILYDLVEKVEHNAYQNGLYKSMEKYNK